MKNYKKFFLIFLLFFSVNLICGETPLREDEIILLDEKFENEEDVKNEIENENVAEEKNYKCLLIGDFDGQLLVEENIYEKRPLASLTKVITLMVAFDEINKGKFSLSDKVTITKESANVGGSRIPLKVGDVVSLQDLVKASGIYSANNATYAIAHYIGGSISNFVKKMNAKIKELGLENEIEVYTPAGLPSHMTKKMMDAGTPFGLYKLALACLKYDKIVENAGIKQTSILNGKIKFKNRNEIIGEQGIYGLKTGYHSKAGFNIILYSSNDNLNLVTVVMGGKSVKQRNEAAVKAIEKTYEKYYYKQIFENGDILTYCFVDSQYAASVGLYVDHNLTKLVNKEDNINLKIKKVDKIPVPVKKDDILGFYSVEINGVEIDSGKLKACEDILK